MMALDVAVGVVILLAAIRGWLRGFAYQVIRIVGLIAAVYLAAPVRDQVKPYVTSYLPSVPPTILERLGWAVAASVTYIVLTGTATLALNMTKRPEIPGMPLQRSRNDQFAGLLLGAAKGALVAAFLLAALDRWGAKPVETMPWALEQTKTSQVLVWSRQYRPAERLWDSVPVQHFVNHIRVHVWPGSADEVSPDAANEVGERPLAQTARRDPADGSGRATRSPEARGTPPDPPAPAAGATRDDRAGAALSDAHKALSGAGSKPD